MGWIFCIVSAFLIVNVLSAPIPTENASIKDPLLMPSTARKFAEIFHYSLEVCGAYSYHQAIELRDNILELVDSLGAFPEIRNADRILFQATAATIANSVIDKEADNYGDAFARASCVMEALRTAYHLTSGTSNTFLLSEVERLIEVFTLKNDVPLFASSSSPAESSFGNYYYDSSEYYEEDYYDSYDSSEYYEDDYYDSYDSSEYYEEDYYDSYDSSEYYEDDYYDSYDSSEYYEEDYYESSSKYVEDYDSSEYYEEYYPEEFYEEYYPEEFYEKYYPEEFYEETPFLIEPYLEDGFRVDEKIEYPFFIEEPEFFKLVPVGYEIEEIPVEELPLNGIREYEPRSVVFRERIPEIFF